jgi:hypothetical protein
MNNYIFKLPAMTGEQKEEPAGLYCPELHNEQDVAPPVAYVPPGHVNGQVVFAKEPVVKHPSEKVAV